MFQGNNWSLELLPCWIGEHGEACSTIYHPNGVGALQISCLLKDSEITDVDLEELAEHHLNAGARVSDAACGEFFGFTLAFGVDGEFWQYWYVCKDNTALVITYNCNEVDLCSELEQVKEMVANLRAT